MPELYTDCPVILGHSLWDEPRINEFSGVAKLCEEYREKYSQYGRGIHHNRLSGVGGCSRRIP